jgi:hypothetical protein
MTQERVKTTQTAVRLPNEVLERLRQSELGVSEEIRRALERVQAQDAIAPLTEAAAKNQRTIADEIEHRLRRTFAEDALDPVTRDLLTAVVDSAASVQANYGAPWHFFDLFVEVLAAAVTRHIHDHKPGPRGGLEDLLRDRLGEPAASQLKEAPDVLGATIARTNQRIHSYEHLRRLQIERQRQFANELTAGPTTTREETRRKEEEKKEEDRRSALKRARTPRKDPEG